MMYYIDGGVTARVLKCYGMSISISYREDITCLLLTRCLLVDLLSVVRSMYFMSSI